MTGSKKSKMKGIPPRVRSKYEFKGFYDFPTKLKNAGDGRLGNLPLVFNESTALTSSRDNSALVIDGTNIVVPNEFVVIGRQQDYDGGGIFTDPVIPPYKDSQQYALDYTLNPTSDEYLLLVSGTPAGNAAGFGQPVWDKSKFTIDLPSTMITPVTMSISQSTPLWNIIWANYILPTLSTNATIGSTPEIGENGVQFNSEYVTAALTGSAYSIFDRLTGALGRSYPMMYYNAVLQTWEPIGRGWTPCASFLPSGMGELDPTISPGYIGSHDHATIGFSPGILNYFEGKQKYIVSKKVAHLSASSFGDVTRSQIISNSIFFPRYATAITASDLQFSNTTWEDMCSAGQPIDDFGFPFAAKYHATSSQLISMKDYIVKPFAVERIAVEFDNVEYTLFDTAYNMLTNTDTTDTDYRNFITSSISPGVINNFFILNQRRNQKLDSTLLLASIYSTLYEGIYKGLQKTITGYVQTFWENGFFSFKDLFEDDYQRAIMEFSDTYAGIVIKIIQYYFSKLPMQLTLPQTTSLNYESFVEGDTTYVDTIREIITWGGISSLSSESQSDYTREFITLSESFTEDYYSKNIQGAYQSSSTASLNPSLIGGLRSPWIRSIPLYRSVIDFVKKKGIKRASPSASLPRNFQERFNIFTDNESSTLLSQKIPGLTFQQASFLATTFLITAANTSPTSSIPLYLPAWISSSWTQDYNNKFSGTMWDIPLSQTFSPQYALSRECTFVSTDSLALQRLPAMSFSRSIKMMLPSKSPSSTNFPDFNTFLWQPNNPADIHPVFCTSTHASLELGGRNGLGAIHLSDREPESGFRNANIVMDQNLTFEGTMFGNVCDGEIEEHVLYAAGNLYPRNFTYLDQDDEHQRVDLFGQYLGYLGYVPSSMYVHGQYYAQVRKLYNLTTESIKKYKNAFYSDTPYVLFPNDELIFGWQQPIPRDISFCNWVSQSFYPTSLTGSDSEKPQAGIVDISCIRIGAGKVVFYGSEIADGKEKHNTLNQYLTACNAYEVID